MPGITPSEKSLGSAHSPLRLIVGRSAALWASAACRSGIHAAEGTCELASPCTTRQRAPSDRSIASVDGAFASSYRSLGAGRDTMAVARWT